MSSFRIFPVMVVLLAIIHYFVLSRDIQPPSAASQFSAANVDGDFLSLVWEEPLLAWSVLDYATICPTVFSFVVLTAYAICSGPSTVFLIASGLRSVLAGIRNSSVWRFLLTGDVLGLVSVFLGVPFQVAYSLLRPQWAENIYSDLAIREDLPVFGAMALVITFGVVCVKSARPLLAFSYGMFGAFVNPSEGQSFGCRYFGHANIPLTYRRQRDVEYQRLFCEGQTIGFELVDVWAQFERAHRQNIEMFQLVAFTAVLAAVCVYHLVEWAIVKFHIQSAFLAWMENVSSVIVAISTVVNGDTTANKVGTPVEPQSSGTHHGADNHPAADKRVHANPDTNSDTDNKLAVMNQMASRIQELERVSSNLKSTASGLRKENQSLAQDLMAKQQSLLNTKTECGELKSVLISQRELSINQEIRMASLQEQVSALEFTNKALQAQSHTQSLELQEAASKQADAARSCTQSVTRSDKTTIVLLKRQLTRARLHKRSLMTGYAKGLQRLSVQENAVKDAVNALEAQSKVVADLEAKNNEQILSIATLKLESSERDIEARDLEKQHDSVVAELKNQLADSTLAAENLRLMVEKKEPVVSEPKEERSQDSGEQQATSPCDGNCQGVQATHALYDALLAENDEEIKVLTEQKEKLQLELDQKAQEVQQKHKQILEQAVMLKQHRSAEKRNSSKVTTTARDNDTIMDNAPVAAATDAADDDMKAKTIISLQEQLAASTARASALGEEVAMATTALHFKQGELDQFSRQVQADRADLVQQYKVALDAAIRQQGEHLVHRVNDLSSREQKLAAEVKELQTYRDKMRGTTAEKAVLENSVVRVVELEGQIHELQQRLHLATQQTSISPDVRISQEIAQLQSRLQAAERVEREYLERQILSTRQIQTLEADLSKARQKLTAPPQTMTSSAKPALRKLVPAAAELNALRTRIGGLVTEVEQKTLECTRLQEQASLQDGTVRDLQAEIARLNSLVSSQPGGQGVAAAGGSTAPEGAKRRRDQDDDGDAEHGDGATMKKSKAEQPDKQPIKPPSRPNRRR